MKEVTLPKLPLEKWLEEPTKEDEKKILDKIYTGSINNDLLWTHGKK